MGRHDSQSTDAGSRNEQRAMRRSGSFTVLPGTSEGEKQADDALYHLLETMSQGVVCLDADGQILSANPAAQSMLAQTLEQLRRRSPLDLPWEAIHEDKMPFSRETHPALVALRTREAVTGVRMGIYHSGEQDYRWISVDAFPQVRPGERTPYRVFAVLQEYTAAWRTQKALDTILAMTEVLVQNIQDAAVIDPQMEEEAVTEERLAHLICHLLNCQRVGIALIDDETENLHPLFVAGVTPEHEYHWTNSLQGVRLGNFLGDPALVQQLRDGEILSLDIVVPLFTDQLSYKRVAPILLGNQLIGILVIGYESASPYLTLHERLLIEAIVRLASLVIVREQALHERDRALTDLKTTREELERVDRMQSNFVSIMSREFRSALTGIQGFSELMRNEDLTAAEMKEFAIDIYSDARRLVRMTTDMLDLNRMQAQRIELNMNWVDLNAIIVDVVSRVRPTTRDHLVRMQLARAIPILLGDREKLTFVISRLLNNAIKYSPDGGEIIVSSVVEGNAVQVSVRDHGVGIPAIDMERIFERYARTDAGQVEGVGHGLPLAREIVRLHGGQIWAESILGAGSVFHFTIPFTGNR